MKRRITLGLALCASALLAVTAAPASANLPQGKGLVDFGTFNCNGVEVPLFGPRGPSPTGFTPEGQHVVATDLFGTFTDPEGNSSPFSKTWGKRSGQPTTMTCTAHFEDPDEGTVDVTVIFGLVPPK
jgi:hypothetical protein